MVVDLMNKRGKIITIEGLDGSGKATQTKLLEQKIASMGINAKYVSFPDYDQPSSTLVKMYLNSEFGEKPSDVNAYAASSFFAIDRYASYMKSWKKYYNSGKIIVADRYISSNIVYQMGKLPRDEWDNFIKWCLDYECIKLGLPMSDAVVYLSVPIDVSQSLMRKRYDGCEEKKDLHEKNIAFLEKFIIFV